MKKIISLLVSILLIFSVSACANRDGQSKIEVYVPDGAPTLSILQLIHENNQFDKEVKYNVVSASQISASVLNKSGENSSQADIAILPVNMASKLIGDATTYKMLGVVTHGNLYIVAKNGVSTIADLQNKTIGVIGQGNVPDLTFRAVLGQNNITCDIRYYTDATTLIPALKQNIVEIGLLPEPACTKLTTSVAPQYNIALDLQALYGGDYPQAVVVAKNSLIKSEKRFVNAFIDAIKNNETFIADNQNVVNGINSVKNIFTETTLDGASYNSQAVTNSKIYFKSAKEEKASVLAYLEQIKGIQANAVGTVIDNFFYE